MSGLWQTPRPAPTRRRSWLIAAGVTWIAAPILGVILVLLGTLVLGLVETGADASGAAIAVGWIVFAGFALVYAPFFSWFGMILAVPLAVALVRSGWAGPGSFVLLGIITGALCGAALTAVAGGSAITFWAGFAAIVGLISATGFRWILLRLEPEIFTNR